VGELVAALGGTPFVGGNLGIPPSEVVPRPGGPEALAFDTLVLEVSSFQAERIPTLAPRRAALLNLSPNHLDRYDGYPAYCDAKGNLFAQQGPGDAAVVPGYEAACVSQARRGRGAVVTFGPRHGEFGGKYDYTFDRDAIVDEARGVAYARRDVRLAGDHNALNVCAALALVADRAPDPEIVREVLARFEGLPHRNVRVAIKRGVTYYDDSKSTSVGASVAAVAGLAEARVVLVAGGRDKQGSYVPLRDALAARGRGLVLIGEAAPLIAATVGDAVPTAHAGSMEDAVALAAAMAQPGDAVLLSPACSSFDMFRDYKDRGDRFVAAVLALPE
jgi:UDP-N-acetylmuramoylalanine--D-glutamate ligase